MTSDFPISYNGSAALFAGTLFAMLLTSSLASMLGAGMIRDLIRDRRYHVDAVHVIRSFVAAICAVLLLLCVPEIAYMISFAESSLQTQQMLLTIKRTCNILSVFPFVWWMGKLRMWMPDIVLKLRNPSTFIWSDNRLPRLARFAAVAALCGAFAAALTLGRALT